MSQLTIKFKRLARFVPPILLLQLTTGLLFTANAAAAAVCTKPKLLGIFVPWYQYLKVGADPVTGSCAVLNFQLLPGGGNSSGLLAILLAIADDMLRLAGLVAVAFVIMGGVQYATSQGSPDATAKAQSTVINALIGLVIALVAVAFVTYLAGALTK